MADMSIVLGIKKVANCSRRVHAENTKKEQASTLRKEKELVKAVMKDLSKKAKSEDGPWQTQMQALTEEQLAEVKEDAKEADKLGWQGKNASCYKTPFTLKEGSGTLLRLVMRSMESSPTDMAGSRKRARKDKAAIRKEKRFFQEKCMNGLEVDGGSEDDERNLGCGSESEGEWYGETRVRESGDHTPHGYSRK